jgi:hypothetical protein
LRAFVSGINLDKIEVFHLLEQHGIRVARSAYVDSPEDAIAFSSRRTAADERMVPIVLRLVPTGQPPREIPHAVAAPLPDEGTIRAAYEALTAGVDLTHQHILAQEFIEAGTDLAVEGRSAANERKLIALRVGGESAEAQLPLDPAAAEGLVTNLRPFHHRGAGEKQRRMVEHLLLNVSDFFANADVESFSLAPLRVHENTYSLIDASVVARRPLHVKERLGRHAHDAKEYGFRPSGRQ